MMRLSPVEPTEVTLSFAELGVSDDVSEYVVSVDGKTSHEIPFYPDAFPLESCGHVFNLVVHATERDIEVEVRRVVEDTDVWATTYENSHKTEDYIIREVSDLTVPQMEAFVLYAIGELVARA